MSHRSAPGDAYCPHRNDAVALMANQYTAHMLGRIPAVRRRVLKLLCPSRPNHDNFCLSVLHTLHDTIHGAHAATATWPASALTHYSAADAILSFTGLPAKTTVTKEQQFRKLAKDVLLCCTDRALTLLAHVLSLGPYAPPPEDNWRGRVRRVTLITSVVDALAAPDAAACAPYSSAGDDSPLWGPLPRCRPAAQRPSVFLPVDDDCNVLAVLSGRRGVDAGSAGGAGGTATQACLEGAAADVPQPEGSAEAGGSQRQLRRTDSSLAEATAAAETLTQLVAAAHAAARARDVSSEEAGVSGDPAGAGTASPFVSEVLQEAQRALTVYSDSQPGMQHSMRSGSDAAGHEDKGPEPAATADTADAPEPPMKARRVARDGSAGTVEAGEAPSAAAGTRVGGEAAAGQPPAHWTQPESPTRRADGAGASRQVQAGPYEGVVDARGAGRGGRADVEGAPRTSPAEEDERTDDDDGAGAEAAGGGAEVRAAAGLVPRVAETVRRAEVVRGPGRAMGELPALWAHMEACAERETAAQLLHKALAGVPGRNKKVRLQMFEVFDGVAAEELIEGQRLELRLGAVRQILSTTTVRPHIPALARLLVLPDDVCRRAADAATVVSAIDYILDFLVSPSAAHLRGEEA